MASIIINKDKEVVLTQSKPDAAKPWKATKFSVTWVDGPEKGKIVEKAQVFTDMVAFLKDAQEKETKLEVTDSKVNDYGFVTFKFRLANDGDRKPFNRGGYGGGQPNPYYAKKAAVAAMTKEQFMAVADKLIPEFAGSLAKVFTLESVKLLPPEIQIAIASEARSAFAQFVMAYQEGIIKHKSEEKTNEQA